MKMIAVDIVLLPQPDIAVRVIAENRKLPPGKIALDDSTSLPHVSLAMGCVNEEALPEIFLFLERVPQTDRCPSLKITELDTEELPTKETVSLFLIAKERPVTRLHRSIMTGMRRYFGARAEREMFFVPSSVEDITLKIVDGFAAHSSFRDFSPHITIGVGALPRLSLNLRFTPSRLAVCQLGNYCTCLKVLWEIRQ